jgi:MFS family permease
MAMTDLPFVSRVALGIFLGMIAAVVIEVVRSRLARKENQMNRTFALRLILSVIAVACAAYLGAVVSPALGVVLGAITGAVAVWSWARRR